jgi:predicted Zn-dependent protease with MMP-like domain
MVEVSRAEFEAMVGRVVATLPEQFAAALDEVRIEVRDRPTSELLTDMGMAEDELLLGLYQGVPLTERSVDGPPTLPPVIHLYQEDIEDASADRDELTEQVRITLLHEIGHHFGLDEDDLERLGYD